MAQKVKEAVSFRNASPRSEGRDLTSKDCFFYEAKFHVGGTVNTHNCRVWETKNPQYVKVKVKTF